MSETIELGDVARYCSFCGKPQGEVAMLIAGSDAYICEECIGTCVVILAERHRDRYAAASQMQTESKAR